MSITYPISPPTTPGFRNVVRKHASVVALGTSPYSGSQQAQEWHDYLAFGLELPPLNDADGEIWEAFFRSLFGTKGTFLLGDPARSSLRAADSAASCTQVYFFIVVFSLEPRGKNLAPECTPNRPRGG